MRGDPLGVHGHACGGSSVCRDPLGAHGQGCAGIPVCTDTRVQRSPGVRGSPGVHTPLGCAGPRRVPACARPGSRQAPTHTVTRVCPAPGCDPPLREIPPEGRGPGRGAPVPRSRPWGAGTGAGMIHRKNPRSHSHAGARRGVRAGWGGSSAPPGRRPPPVHGTPRAGGQGPDPTGPQNWGGRGWAGSHGTPRTGSGGGKIPQDPPNSRLAGDSPAPPSARRAPLRCPTSGGQPSAEALPGGGGSDTMGEP